MRKKLLSIPSNQWFRLDDRPDKDAVVDEINGLIESGYRFIFSECGNKFMRLCIDLFEWAESKPPGSEIRIRNINGKKFYDLYFENRLIAVK